MPDNSNDKIGRVTERVTARTEHPIPPASPVVTPFNTIQEWLQYLCEHEHRSEPVSEYLIVFSEPPHVLAGLYGRNHSVEEGVSITRVVFQPKKYMWFQLPTKEYGGLKRRQLIEKIHAELKEFFTTEVFGKSFLALGYTINTNFQRRIWSV